MPFVTQDHRDEPDLTIPGDLCYVFYKELVDQWKLSPRWTTADRLYACVRVVEGTRGKQRAKELAWQVFFQLYVMPYELEKRAANGDI